MMEAVKWSGDNWYYPIMADPNLSPLARRSVLMNGGMSYVEAQFVITSMALDRRRPVWILVAGPPHLYFLGNAN